MLNLDPVLCGKTGLAHARASDEAQRLEVLAGLRAHPPRISPKWFYDTLGSALFEAITRVPEYYPTRCEMEIFHNQGEAITATLPANLAVIELGSGSAQKVAALLPKLQKPRSYHPIDVSAAAIEGTVTELAARFPHLPVVAFRGDFTQAATIRHFTSQVSKYGPVLLFFPGSTLGNFDVDQAARLLAECGRGLPEGTPFLLGIDLIKDPSLLEAAYDDAAGVTAAFNRNVLAHLNRRFDADFDLRGWTHEARWIPRLRRIEMWLRARGDQRVRFGSNLLHFANGTSIHTESSHKWDRPSLAALAHASGWQLDGWWTDSNGWFAEVLLRRSPDRREIQVD